MSEFKIIKCKSCDASLVELQGENIKKCVQCGYNFTHKVNTKAKLESVVELAYENQTNNYNPPTQKKQSLIQTNNQSTSQSKPQTSTQSQKQESKRKNPTSIIGTIIKWYIIVYIGSRVLQEIF